MGKNRQKRTAKLKRELQQARNELARQRQLHPEITAVPPQQPLVPKESGATLPARGRPPAPRQLTLRGFSFQAESFSGPLPHPEILQRYDDIVPGAAQQIITDAHGQTKHRQELEKLVIARELRRADLGLGAGFIVALISILSSAYLVLNNHPVAGSILGGTTVVSLVGTFVYGSVSRKKERETKSRVMAGEPPPEKDKR